MSILSHNIGSVSYYGPQPKHWKAIVLGTWKSARNNQGVGQNVLYKKFAPGTSLEVQWLRVCLAMQGT